MGSSFRKPRRRRVATTGIPAWNGHTRSDDRACMGHAQGGRVAHMWKRVLLGCVVVSVGVAAHQSRRGAVPEQLAPTPDLDVAAARADTLRDGVARALRDASAASTDSARA